jgi:hypothetical protein
VQHTGKRMVVELEVEGPDDRAILSIARNFWVLTNFENDATVKVSYKQ